MPRRQSAAVLTRPLSALAALVAALLLVAAPPAVRAQEDLAWGHAISMLGDVRYGPDAVSFDYADPDAPKHGVLHMAVPGAYDSLNPFIVVGRTAAGIRGYHFASLMARAWDEPFTMYPYAAEAVAVAEDRSWVAFRLNPEARFHDGTPITVDDVVFTLEILREHGLPGFRTNYAKVDRVERLGTHGVRFWFNEDGDWESPMILALMPILSRAYYTDTPITEPSLQIPLGSGPYRVSTVDPGRRIAYERVEGWWGEDLLAFRGQYNFDRIVFDYYRDDTVALEAFAAGDYSLRRETSAQTWAISYDFPAVAGGQITLLDIAHGRPSGLRGFVFNTRRPIFADRRTRQALSMVFDFDWVNQNLMSGLYARVRSLFDNSFLAPEGVAEGRELEILEPFRDALPPEVFEGVYEPQPIDGPAGLREALRGALALLDAAGWQVAGSQMTQAGTGRPFTFEILIASEADQPVALAYADNLRRLGVQAGVRRVDSAEYQSRLERYDFDMIIHRWGVTLSPGTEQYLYWGSGNATTPGSRNYAGVSDPAIDAAIEALVAARTREEMDAAARALDRMLMWGFYVVPLEYDPQDHIAFWGSYARVEGYDPIYGTVLEAWWMGRD